jgi:hypothetical protein
MVVNTRDELLHQVTRGNDAAKDFLSRTIHAFHVWDDLIDQDKPLDPTDITKAFFHAFVGLPSNPFYAANFSHLYPIIANAVTNWQAANEMERTPKDSLDTEIAFIIRSEYINLIIETARLCGGHEWAQEITTEVRRFSHSEGYAGYLKNLAQEKECRDARNQTH